MPAHLLPFVAVTALLTLTPGPDMALVLRNGIRGGARSAWWTGLGCCTGIAAWGAAAVLGLSALMAASAAAFTVVKFAGACYLLYLGAMSVWHSRRAEESSGTSPTPIQPAAADRRRAFRQGLVSNLLNPKIGLIFLTLIPQFVGAHEPKAATSAVLAAVFLAMAVVWWRVFSLGVAALGRAFSRPRVRRTMDRVTGVALIALGLRVATER